jgi:hypothetical protein
MNKLFVIWPGLDLIYSKFGPSKALSLNFVNLKFSLALLERSQDKLDLNFHHQFS